MESEIASDKSLENSMPRVSFLERSEDQVSWTWREPENDDF